jgi:molybdopterin-guanine dinucleotide biosynthesis protein B
MIPILSIVGKSDSGKTFLIETLVLALKEKGYRIATVKHDVHGFAFRKRGLFPGGKRG